MANLFLPLIQAAGDVAERLDTIGVEEEELEQFDPRLRALIQSGSLDDETAALLARKERGRVQNERIQARVLKNRRKLEEDEEQRDSIFAKIRGVPVGFQFGSAAGIDNPVAAFLVDLLADPLNFLTGVGVTTKLGRAAKFLTKGGSLIPAKKRAEALAAGVRTLARSALDPDFADDIARSVESFNFKRLQKLFADTGKKKFGDDALSALEKFGDEGTTLAKLLRNEKNEIRGMTAAFELASKGASPADAFGAGFIEQMAKGQRTALRFGVPFTALEGSIGFKSYVNEFVKDGDAIKTLRRPFAAAFDAAKTTARNKALFELSESMDPSNFKQLMDDASVTRVRYTNALKPITPGVDISDAPLPASISKVTFTRAETVRNSANEFGAALHFATEDDAEVRNLLTRLLDGDKDLIKQFDELIAEEQFLAIDGPTRGAIPESAGRVKILFGQARKLMDDTLAEAKDSETLVEGVENYITHLLEFTGSRQENEIRALIRKAVEKDLGTVGGHTVSDAVRSRFGFRRAFQTIRDIEKHIARTKGAKLRFKTLDVDQVVHAYMDSMGQSIVKNRAMQSLKNLRVPGQDGLSFAMTQADLAKMPKGARQFIEDNYITASKGSAFNNPEKGRVWLFHPDIWPTIKPAVERDWITDMARAGKDKTAGFARALDKANTLGKASLFNLNPFFHMAALTYSNFALLPFGTAVRSTAHAAKESFDLGLAKFSDIIFRKHGGESKFRELALEQFLKRRSKTLKLRGVPGVDGTDITELMKTSGLKLGRAELGDEGFSVVDGLLKRAQETLSEKHMLLKPAEFGVAGVRHLNDFGDKALWGVMLDGYKQTAFSYIMAGEVNRLAKLGKLSDEFLGSARASELGGEVAQIVNQAFGGLMFERMGMTPSAQKLMRMALLAPDWTSSNLLMARDAFVNMPGMEGLIGKVVGFRDIVMPDVRFRWALAYNMRAAFYLTIMGNLLNYATTSLWHGEGKFLWDMGSEAYDPDTRMKSRIRLWDREDGRGLFMDISKQFTEPLRGAFDPGKFALSKMGVLPRVFQTTVLGQDAFGNPIAGADEGPYADLVLRAWTLAGQFAPISGQTAASAVSNLIVPGSAVDQRGLPASLISSAVGFSIRSESKERFDTKAAIKRDREKLRQLQLTAP